MSLGKLFLTPVTKPLKWGVKGTWWGAKQLYGGNLVGRSMVAGGVGGIYGFATSPLSGTDALGDAASYGIFGAALGATSWIGPRLAKRAFRSPTFRRGAWGTMGFVGRRARGVGSFAFRHPGLTAAGVGAIAFGPGLATRAAGGQTMESPTLGGADVNIEYNQQAMAAQEIMAGAISPMGGAGTYPQFLEMERRRAMERSRLQHSTHGLVQGLYRGRHG